MTNSTPVEIEAALACADSHVDQVNNRSEGNIEQRPLLALRILSKALRVCQAQLESAAKIVYDWDMRLGAVRERAEKAERDLREMTDCRDHVLKHHGVLREDKEKAEREADELREKVAIEERRRLTWMDDCRKQEDRAEAAEARERELREALEGMNELFDNYGHASESPCVRDKEIIAKMLKVLAASDSKASGQENR